MEATKRPALPVEEAALLPALPRMKGAGKAALKAYLAAAERMEGLQVREVLPAQARKEATPRAALRHVLRG